MRCRPLLLALGLATLTAACGSDEAAPPETLGEPTEAPTTELTTADWDLVALGDSTPTGYGAGPPGSAYTYQFAELVEQDLDIDVVVHDHSANTNRTVAQWVDLVETDEALRADLAGAEIVTIWLGWHDVINTVMVFDGEWSDDVEETFAELTATTPSDFDELLALITETAPTARVVIADVGIPRLFIERWANEPYWPEMKQAIYLTWRDALVEAAHVHGAALVQSYRTLNGPTGDDVGDPTWIQGDGLHFTAEGHAFLAQLHHAEAALTAD